MGLAKEQLENDECYQTLAEKALRELGYLDFCSMHGINIDKGCIAEDDVYAKSINWLKKYFPDRVNFKLFSKSIKKLIDETILRKCPICEKINED